MEQNFYLTLCSEWWHCKMRSLQNDALILSMLAEKSAICSRIKVWTAFRRFLFARRGEYCEKRNPHYLRTTNRCP